MINKFNVLFKIIIIFFCIFWSIKEVIFPLSIALIYSKQFMNEVYHCDKAMEADWYYKQSKEFDSKANEIQMISCHEYDKTRKIMLISGLPEEYLSWLGLKSLELYQRPVNEFTKQHKFIQR